MRADSAQPAFKVFVQLQRDYTSRISPAVNQMLLYDLSILLELSVAKGKAKFVGYVGILFDAKKDAAF